MPTNLDELRLSEMERQRKRNEAALAGLKRRQEESEKIAEQNQRMESVPEGVAASFWRSWAWTNGGRVCHKVIDEEDPWLGPMVRILEDG